MTGYERPPAQSGFTLIEIIIVLVLMGLAGSIVLPNMASLYDRVMLRSQQDEILQQLSTLGFRAYNHTSAVHLTNNSEDHDRWLDLPEGWSLTVNTPILYKASGFCAGGMIALRRGHSMFEYHLIPPYCKPEIIE